MFDGADAVQRRVVLVLDGHGDALLRALNIFFVARAHCVSIDYVARGAEAMAIIDVLHDSGPALDVVVNKVAGLHCVLDIKLLATAES